MVSLAQRERQAVLRERQELPAVLLELPGWQAGSPALVVFLVLWVVLRELLPFWVAFRGLLAWLVGSPVLQESPVVSLGLQELSVEFLVLPAGLPMLLGWQAALRLCQDLRVASPAHLRSSAS